MSRRQKPRFFAAVIEGAVSKKSLPGRSYAPGQAAKTALFAAVNVGAVSKKSLAIFSNRQGDKK